MGELVEFKCENCGETLLVEHPAMIIHQEKDCPSGEAGSFIAQENPTGQ